MKTARPIYTIGHRNPDTDSVCSAIGYAHLKQAQGQNVVPARAGKLNAETKYVLAKFNVKPPVLITDLYPRVKDVALDCDTVIRASDSLRKLGELMHESAMKSVPVVDKDGILIGIVTVSDLAKRYFTELSMQNLAESGVALSAVIEVIDGEIVVESNVNEKITGNVRIAAGSAKTIQKVVRKGDVVVAGDRTDDVLLTCIEKGIGCLIVTASGHLPAEVIEAAEEKRVMVVSSPFDTYTCARLVNQCIPVSAIMKKSVTMFKPTDMLSDIKDIMETTQFRNYPVVENERLVGVVSRDKLAIPERAKVILVDHNERSQAVEGIEAAKVIEIIDHHRIGGIQTSEPIFTYQAPLGSTATIVANLHWQNNVEIPADIAGLLLSAIISDTVLFKSPTCTPTDIEVAKRLAKIIDIDLYDHGMAMLRAGSSVNEMTPAEIAKNDMKEFQIVDYRITVSQISVMDPQGVLDSKDQILAYMENTCNIEGYDMCMLMVTDIVEEGTHLLYAGKPKMIIGEAFKKDASGSLFYLPGVMSRKKQIIPPMVEAAQKYASQA